MPEDTITLTEQKLIRIEEIVMDEDEKAALAFLRQLKADLEKREKGKLKPVVGQTEL